jgi:uncharacterized membrane protein HdeD (DUF308 family)
MTLVALTLLFGVFAFVDGVLSVVAALGSLGVAGASRWWALLLQGIIGLIVAFFVWSQPAMSTAVLVYAVAAWAIVTGIVEVVAGIQLRDVVTNEWMYVLAGIVSIAFGIWVVRNPGAGALSIAWIIGVYAVVFGVLELGVSYRLNKVRTAIPTTVRST